ncbi:MAG TPA: SIMPL domain-containing protein [Gaiellaceae bacterium]|jgi:uncharacterized protein YggE
MKSLGVIGAVVAVLVAGVAGAGGATSAAAAQHSIVVSGTGAVTTVPDRAQVSFGVSTDGKTASAALRANAAEMTRVIAALKAQGIAAADIRTDLISLSPRYSQSGDAVVGYTATNSVSATVRNLAKVGAVIDAAVDAGANQVSGPNLVRSDSAALYRAALRAAVADAKGKAQAIAAASGLHIRRISDVTEGSAAPPPVPLTAKASGDTTTPVEPGTTQIEATVAVTFAVA